MLSAGGRLNAQIMSTVAHRANEARWHLDRKKWVSNIRSQQRNSLRCAGHGGDVPRVISGRRIGAARANTLDPNCGPALPEVSRPQVNHADAMSSGRQSGSSERRRASLQVGSAEAGAAGHEGDGADRIELGVTEIGDSGGQNDRLSQCRRPGLDRKDCACGQGLGTRRSGAHFRCGPRRRGGRRCRRPR